jgi:hypothetical protein
VGPQAGINFRTGLSGDTVALTVWSGVTAQVLLPLSDLGSIIQPGCLLHDDAMEQ